MREPPEDGIITLTPWSSGFAHPQAPAPNVPAERCHQIAPVQLFLGPARQSMMLEQSSLSDDADADGDDDDVERLIRVLW